MRIVVVTFFFAILSAVFPVFADQTPGSKLLPNDFWRLAPWEVNREVLDVSALENTNDFADYVRLEYTDLNSLGPAEQLSDLPFTYYVSEPRRRLNSDHFFAARWIAVAASSVIARKLQCELEDSANCKSLTPEERRNILVFLDQLGFDVYFYNEDPLSIDLSPVKRDFCVSFFITFGIMDASSETDFRGISAIEGFCTSQFPESTEAFVLIKRLFERTPTLNEAFLLRDEVSRLSSEHSIISIWLGMYLFHVAPEIVSNVRNATNNSPISAEGREFIELVALTISDRGISIEDGAFLKATFLKIGSKLADQNGGYIIQSRPDLIRQQKLKSAIMRTNCYQIMPSGFEC